MCKNICRYFIDLLKAMHCRVPPFLVSNTLTFLVSSLHFNKYFISRLGKECASI